MELKHAYKKQDIGGDSKLLLKIPNEDFIPFSSYYNKNTIITKNGGLLQTIRITGFAHEFISSESVNIREVIRDSISNHIDNNNYAIWIHTIRREKNIYPDGEFKELIPKIINDVWRKKNNWDNQWTNELYITILISGSDHSSKFISALRYFSSKSTSNFYKKKLIKFCDELTKKTNLILNDLKSYGAKIIGIRKWNNLLYSESMRVFGKIINLVEDRFPLTFNDIGNDLAKCEILFGSNVMEIIGHKQKHFASLFSIKEISEISMESLDKLLQLPQEFVITESLDFINRDEALPKFDYQNYILEVSEDEDIKHLSGLGNIIKSDERNITDYAERQMTIMVFNEDRMELNRDINMMLKSISSLGIIAIREDAFLEHCFWSQLPGNFYFLSRQYPASSRKIGDFASLHNFPTGKANGNHWGNAVTIFRTLAGTPYFFNFHYEDNGHMMIIGPFGSGKTALLNFIIAQSRKFNNKLFYFDCNHASEIFIRSLGGEYLSITTKMDNREALKINPLNLENNQRNKEFLTNWFKYLSHYGDDIPEKESLQIPNIVQNIMDSNIKKLSDASNLFKDTPKIQEKLSIWHDGGKFAFIFDHIDENDLNKNIVHGFNLTPILNKKGILVPIITYLLYKIEISLDGNPAMIVLDEAWELLDNYAIAPILNDFLIRMKEKNCVVIFATEAPSKASDSNITKTIHEDVSTHIFLPNQDINKESSKVFGITDQEIEIISSMLIEERHFLLKHANSSIIASLDLSEMSDEIKILSSDKDSLKKMRESINKNGIKPEEWVSDFLE